MSGQVPSLLAERAAEKGSCSMRAVEGNLGTSSNTREKEREKKERTWRFTALAQRAVANSPRWTRAPLLSISHYLKRTNKTSKLARINTSGGVHHHGRFKKRLTKKLLRSNSIQWRYTRLLIELAIKVSCEKLRSSY